MEPLEGTNALRRQMLVQACTDLLEPSLTSSGRLRQISKLLSVCLLSSKRGSRVTRASIRGGARCLFSGTGLAGFRLKQLDRRPVRILWVYDTHHGLAGTGIRVVE